MGIGNISTLATFILFSRVEHVDHVDVSSWLAARARRGNDCELLEIVRTKGRRGDEGALHRRSATRKRLATNDCGTSESSGTSETMTTN